MLPCSSAFASFLAGVFAGVPTNVYWSIFLDKEYGPKNTHIHLEDVKTILSVKHVETHPQKQQPGT